LAGPSLLAMILVAKFLDHQPLNRQSAAYAREGVEIDPSTLADRVGACVVALEPIVSRVRPGRRTHSRRRHDREGLGEDEVQNGPHLGLCA
jgi:transposase